MDGSSPTAVPPRQTLGQVIAEVTDAFVPPADAAERRVLSESPDQPDGRQLASLLLTELARTGPIDEPLAEQELARTATHHAPAAEQLLEHRVELLGGYGPQAIGDPIDWFHAPGKDLQWPTHLSRHRWLMPLGWMYRATGEAVYAQKVIQVLLDWVERCPLDSDALEQRAGDWSRRWADQPGEPTLREAHFPGYADGPWTALSAHARCEVWTELLALLHDAPAMTNQTLALIIRSLLRDHWPLMLQYPRQMNQYLGIACTLAKMGMFYGRRLRPAQRAGEVGWSRAQKWACREIYPDGSLAECSPNYGLGSMENLARLVALAERRRQPVAAAIDERLRLGTRYMALVSTPKGRSPRIAKGGQLIRDRLAELNGRYGDEQVRFVASAFIAGREPPARAHAFNWAGHIVMRDRWDEAATWVFFEPGPRGSGHHDVACLNVLVYAGHQWLLADPGFYAYGGEGWVTRLMRYLKSSAAHNVALVDERGQRSTRPGDGGPNTQPGSYGFADDGRLVQACGTYNAGFGPVEAPLDVTHERQLAYDRRANTLTVTDTFHGTGSHRLDLHWQLAPGARVTLGDGVARFAIGEVGAEMAFSQDGPVSLEVCRGWKDPVRGWYSDSYGHLEPAPLLRATVQGTLPRQIRTQLRIGR